MTGGKLARDITAIPSYTPWTLAELKTAAWLVDNSHLAKLETLLLTSDLDTSSVSTELATIKSVVDGSNTASDETILGQLMLKLTSSVRICKSCRRSSPTSFPDFWRRLCRLLCRALPAWRDCCTLQCVRPRQLEEFSLSGLLWSYLWWRGDRNLLPTMGKLQMGQISA